MGLLRVPECEGYPLIGAHPRRHAPPGCRDGDTALMYAAINDHPAIVARLVAARADLNATKSAVALLVGGADHTVTNNDG